MLRKFGFKKGEPKETEARLKLQKELFSFSQCTDHGFPNKPTTLAYDQRLQLLAVGTRTGSIKVFGQPGVECQTELPGEETTVTQLYFLPQQARLLSLCGDNSIHLLEINEKDGASTLDHLKSYSMENSKLKAISCSTLTSDSTSLLLGTEGGNIHILDVNNCTLTEQIIYQDVVMQNVPDDFKVNPGAVECIQQHPKEEDKFLLGYNRGLIVLWDRKENIAEKTYNATQQLENICWHRDGTQFMSAHADGSYITWDVNDSTKHKETHTPYGPFPCKAINKMQWKTAKSDSFIIFSGGMPRGTYGDRHTISVWQDKSKQIVFDFTSRVIDFVVLSNAELNGDTQAEHDEPHTLLALVEEELVAIDLLHQDWKPFRQPYLWSLHSSAIMCSYHVNNVPEQFWNKIKDAGNTQMNNYSDREWPIAGGVNNGPTESSRDLFLTGHEDGTVRFWDASTVCLQLLYKLNTAIAFDINALDTTNTADEEDWPPFKKCGTFDPYSDDPRLGVQKLILCALSETLVVAGTAGQVICLQFEREEREVEIRQVSVNIVSDRDGFVWKGHDALPMSSQDVKVPAGFQPASVVQLHPPAAITALTTHSQWQLLAIGTAHGCALYDYAQKCEVSTKCTLNPNDLTGTGDSAMSRRKSFKKSLRESFRRLRKRRSERRKRGDEKPDKPEAKSKTPKKKRSEADADVASGSGEAPTPSVEVTTPASDVRSVERCVESRVVQEDGLTSMVRTLYFADTFLTNAQNHTPILCVGTNAGTVYMFQITLPADDKRDTDRITCQLAKEIHLKHHAPVLSVCVVDRTHTPLPGPLEVTHQRAKEADMTGNHQIVICSEEQLKVFALPGLSARNKYKLTAHEGSKVRKVAYVNFTSKSDDKYNEYDIALLTNQGDFHIYTIPNLRRQLKSDCIRKENILGITTCVITNTGSAFYLLSSSEFAQVSLSARLYNAPQCQIIPVEGLRAPPPQPDTPKQKSEPEAKPEDPPASATDAADVKTDDVPASGGESPVAKESADTIEAASPTTDDEKVVTGNDTANDSIATGDMTIDSVKVHMGNDDSTFTKSEVVQSSLTRTVVSKTVVSGIANDGSTTVVRSETTTVQNNRESPETTTTTTTTTMDHDTEGKSVVTKETVESTDDIIDYSNKIDETGEVREVGIEVEELEALQITEDEHPPHLDLSIDLPVLESPNETSTPIEPREINLTAEEPANTVCDDGSHCLMPAMGVVSQGLVEEEGLEPVVEESQRSLEEEEGQSLREEVVLPAVHIADHTEPELLLDEKSVEEQNVLNEIAEQPLQGQHVLEEYSERPMEEKNVLEEFAERKAEQVIEEAVEQSQLVEAECEPASPEQQPEAEEMNRSDVPEVTEEATEQVQEETPEQPAEHFPVSAAVDIEMPGKVDEENHHISEPVDDDTQQTDQPAAVLDTEAQLDDLVMDFLDQSADSALDQSTDEVIDQLVEQSLEQEQEQSSVDVEVRGQVQMEQGDGAAAGIVVTSDNSSEQAEHVVDSAESTEQQLKDEQLRENAENVQQDAELLPPPPPEAESQLSTEQTNEVQPPVESEAVQDVPPSEDKAAEPEVEQLPVEVATTDNVCEQTEQQEASPVSEAVAPASDESSVTQTTNNSEQPSDHPAPPPSVEATTPTSEQQSLDLPPPPAPVEESSPVEESFPVSEDHSEEQLHNNLQEYPTEDATPTEVKDVKEQPTVKDTQPQTNNIDHSASSAQ